jgi:hypothetical protein
MNNKHYPFVFDACSIWAQSGCLEVLSCFHLEIIAQPLNFRLARKNVYCIQFFLPNDSRNRKWPDGRGACAARPVNGGQFPVDALVRPHTFLLFMQLLIAFLGVLQAKA